MLNRLSGLSLLFRAPSAFDKRISANRRSAKGFCVEHLEHRLALTTTIVDKEPNNSFDQYQKLSGDLDYVVNGKATSGDNDFFAVTLSQGDEITWQINQIGGTNSRTDANLYGPRNNYLGAAWAYNQVSNIGTPSFSPAVEPGAYLIGVAQGVFFQPSAYTSASGYILKVSINRADHDDEIAESIAIGDMTANRVKAGTFDGGSDVDMYSITVSQGQLVRFDVDVKNQSFPSYLRLFNSSGVQIAKQWAAFGPNEKFYESYLHYRFKTAGTYYVGISGEPNVSYNALDGSGDVPSTTVTGTYQLRVSPLDGVTAIIAQEFDVPRPDVSPTPQSPSSIAARLTRIGGKAIESNKSTWIVIHGRDSNDSALNKIAYLVQSRDPNAQVLQLDWRVGAADNYPKTGIVKGLDGAGWIPAVANWAAGVATAIGFTNANLSLVGHSWGSYLAYEISARIPRGVHSLIALDPARAGGSVPWISATGVVDDPFDDYNESRVNFQLHSVVSWAFYGAGIYGSAALSATADQAFAINYAGRIGANPDSDARHSAPLRLFENLLSTPTPWSSYFTLSKLRDTAVGPGTDNTFTVGSSTDKSAPVPLAYENPTLPKFEGVFTMSLDSAQYWTRVSGFQFMLNGAIVNQSLNKISNGDFESGKLTGWTVTAGGQFPMITTHATTSPDGGLYAVQLSDAKTGLGPGKTAAIQQTVYIPTGANAPLLGLRYRVMGSDTSSKDWMRVYVDGAPIVTWSTDSAGWKVFCYDMSAYKGKNVSIKIASSKVDNNGGAFYYVDNISVLI
jgi:pimeloyl-ACP methyl ester carboxylesterase